MRLLSQQYILFLQFEKSNPQITKAEIVPITLDNHDGNNYTPDQGDKIGKIIYMGKDHSNDWCRPVIQKKKSANLLNGQFLIKSF